MNKSFSPRRASLLLVAALAAATLAGHLLTTGTAAVPVRPPGIPAPGVPASGGIGAGGIDFVSPGSSPVQLRGRLDRTAVLAGVDGVVKMELVLAAEERPAGARMPTDFVIVLDRSGSMDGVKIERARAAVRELVSQLTSEDRFALVTYASQAEVAIPLTEASERARQAWRGTVAAIYPGGGTNMSGGLDLALDVTSRSEVGRARRLILISDGLANEGDPTIPGLADRARRAARREAVVSTVGVGADFNELLMSAVADAGTGNYYYLQDVEQLAAVFADELGATRETVASALEVAFEPGAGVRVVDAAGYPLEHAWSAAGRGRTTFRPGSLFSGQERRIWVTFEVAGDAPGERSLGTVTASYRDRGVTRVVELTDVSAVACVADAGEYHASFDKETWARSVAEEDYNRLQQRVAGYVQAGRRDAALEEIAEFRGHKQEMNRVMQRREIARKLEELTRLQEEVEDAFEGADQASKRNRLSKARQAEALDARRAGGKRGGSR